MFNKYWKISELSSWIHLKNIEKASFCCFAIDSNLILWHFLENHGSFHTVLDAWFVYRQAVYRLLRQTRSVSVSSQFLLSLGLRLFAGFVWARERVILRPELYFNGPHCDVPAGFYWEKHLGRRSARARPRPHCWDNSKLRRLFWFCHFWLDIWDENNNKSTYLSIFICYLAFFDKNCLNLSQKIHTDHGEKKSRGNQ